MMKSLFTHPFTRFVFKKVVFYLIVAFVALTFIFLIPRLMSTNPVDLMFRGAVSTPSINMTAVKEVMMGYFGLNKPLFDQYVSFWGQLFTGNLGPSFKWYPQPVMKFVLGKLPFTLALVVPVLFISFFLGNWIGAKAAYVGGKWSEFVYFFSVFSNRLPSFWFGMVLFFLLAAQAKLFPLYGYSSIGQIPSWDLNYFLDVLHHYLLPFFTLLFVYLGGWATGMRSMMIHEMDSGYVRYSEQLGFRKNKSMSYAQRNAILPQFTGLNLYFNALIGETTVLEAVFGWPGIGKLMFDAVMSYDYPMILGGFLVTMCVVILGNFLIDITYGFIDPRIRTGSGR
jgi:peptide/nickel transport system permease protein